MKPIDKICIAKSITFIKSIKSEEKMKYCDNIHQLQPHAFLTIIAMMREGVSLPKLVHAIHILMVMHHAFYSNCRSLPLITRDMLRDALEGNAAMLQSIERGWLTHAETVSSYPEKIILAFIVCYMKDNNLISPCEENARLMMRIKIVLDTYVKAKSVAAHSVGLH
jgi:hypothetical protein